MSKLSNEILLVLAYVSQITDPNSVRSRFIESLNALDDAFTFKFVDRLPPGLPENRVLPIATLRSSFGFAVIAEGPETTETDRAVLRNAFQFLAVLLENRMQAHILESTNISLLKESENKYRLLADNVSDVIFVLDMNLNYTYISPSVKILRGYEPEEALKQAAVETLAPSSRNLAMRILSEVIELEKSEQREILLSRTLQLEMNRKDGTTVWTEVKFSFIRDEDQRPVAILGVTRDITTRRKAEEDLRRTNIFLDSIIENIPNMIFLKDEKDLRFLRLNRAGEELLGYSRNDLLGKNDYDFFPKEQADDFVDKDRNVLHGKNLLDIPEEHIQTRNKGERLLHTKKVPLLNSQGEPEYLLGISEDITERKRAEEEKLSLQERLNRAEKMESLGLLAGGVAHDLNNVLGIVVGYAELLLFKANESSAIRPQLEEIMKGGQKAAAIVEDLLTLARRGVPSRNILNLNKIIADNQKSPEFVNLFSHHSDVKIKTDLEPELLNISGSTIHLGKTIFNLVSNATEAMPKGGVLTIRTANQYLDNPIQGYDEIREGDYVILSVSDTGEGIHEADLKRIFEPFYTKKVMGRSGTGLGLAVVWGTVKDHNGYINVESEEGKGSTFTLYFPVTREELSVDHVAVPISEYMGKGESILIVDDVKGQRYLAEEMLKKLNYSVASVSSGEEAVAYLKEHKADLMVLDMIMDPGMDGLDTYKKVLEIRPEQKAIIVSGFSESDRVKAAKALGAGAYVRKPYVIEKLGLAVRKELERAV